MSEHRSAAELLREAAQRDPEAHWAALGRAYGVGPPDPTWCYSDVFTKTPHHWLVPGEPHCYCGEVL